MDIKKRFILTVTEFIASDKLGRTLFALMTGEKIDDYNFLADELCTKRDEASYLLKGIRKLIEGHKNDFTKEASIYLERLENCIRSRNLLVIVSGPSAVGKDQVALDCIERLNSEKIKAQFLYKYATRVSRPGEKKVNGRHFDPTAYYVFKPSVNLWRDPDVFFCYTKYEHTYGFSKSHLIESEIETAPKVLFAIFGAVDKYSDFLKKLRTLTTRKIFSVLLKVTEADKKVLWWRQMARDTIPDAEKNIRLQEMERDMRYIYSHKEIIDKYDFVLDNGLYDSIGKTEDTILENIRPLLKL